MPCRTYVRTCAFSLGTPVQVRFSSHPRAMRHPGLHSGSAAFTSRVRRTSGSPIRATAGETASDIVDDRFTCVHVLSRVPPLHLPEGLGINRGMHNALDACWAAGRWGEARAGGDAAEASVPDEVIDFFPMCFGSC